MSFRRRPCRLAIAPGFTLLELMLVVAVVGIALGSILPYVPQLTEKSRLTEVFTKFSVARIEIHEDIAVRGISVGGHTDGGESCTSTGQQSLEEALGIGAKAKGQMAKSCAGGKPGTAEGSDKDKAESKSTSAAAIIEIARDGANLLGRGHLATGERFVLPFVPSVIDQGPTGSVIWLCGNRAPLPGWKRLAPAPPMDLPDRLNFSVCRNNT